MARAPRIPFVSFCVTCAMFVIVAWSTPTFGQPFTSVTTSQQRMSTGRLSIDQEIQLGNDYLIGHGVSKDEKQAAYWYEKAAEAGEPSAQKQIGFFYQAGIGVTVDPVRAVHWYQLAAANGLVTARTNLGVAFLWGNGVARDVRMAAQLFREAAEKGDGRAATYLGNMYFAGNGVPQDKGAAEHWYSVGAKQHDPVAEFDLGALFSVEDHPHDFEKAVKWLRKSIDGGYVPAMHSLALLLKAHPEMEKSDREFLNLFERASGYGQWKSSLALGMLLSEGRLVPRDPGRAYYYLELAALQGGDGAPQQTLSQMLQRLWDETGNEEASKQESAARGWYREHPDRIELLMGDHGKDSSSRYAIAVPAEGIHAGLIVNPPAS
jgi:TPR repeat protein